MSPQSPQSSQSPLRTSLVVLVACMAALVAVLTSAAGPAAAAKVRTRAERRASMVWLLAATDARLNRAVLDDLGPDTTELLIDIANTPRESATVRVRALAGLGFYASEDSYAFLSSLLNERNLVGTPEGSRMRRQAARSLGAAHGDRSVDELLMLRGDPEAGVRQAVAAALGDAGSARALPMLDLWLSAEQDIAVRVAIDRAITQLRER